MRPVVERVDGRSASGSTGRPPWMRQSHAALRHSRAATMASSVSRNSVKIDGGLARHVRAAAADRSIFELVAHRSRQRDQLLERRSLFVDALEPARRQHRVALTVIRIVVLLPWQRCLRRLRASCSRAAPGGVPGCARSRHCGGGGATRHRDRDQAARPSSRPRALQIARDIRFDRGQQRRFGVRRVTPRTCERRDVVRPASPRAAGRS